MTDSESSEPGDRSIPYQMVVYFDEFPDIDPEKLQDFINSCDPSEESDCEVSLVDDMPRGEVRLGGIAIELGEFVMGILTHGVPSPEIATIEHSRLSDKLKQKLKGHGAFALLTNTGGE